jgi:ABC-type enterochelin transport system substrate-binding protein
MTRKFFIPAALALAAAALFGACKATDTGVSTSATAGSSQAAGKSAPAATTTTEVHADGARRVGPAELQKMIEGGNVVVYDTRSKASYDQEHIKDALSMPSDEVERRVAEFPRDKTLVFYCT